MAVLNDVGLKSHLIDALKILKAAALYLINRIKWWLMLKIGLVEVCVSQILRTLSSDSKKLAQIGHDVGQRWWYAR